MFRHESVYVIGEFTSRLSIALTRYDNNPYIDWTFHNNKLYIVTNGNFILDLKEQQEVNAHAQVLLTYINYYRVSEDTFFNNEIGYNMMRYTFCIITQISTSRELNRVSPNNIAEQSTRYVYENGNICRPHWISSEEAEAFNKDNNVDLDEAINIYLKGCERDFEEYHMLVDKYKINRQDARGKLPIDTATKCIYTYSINEWKHIIKLRSDSTAHPNAQIISNMIKKELESLGYEFN